MANDASMIFRIKGDASHVKKELASLGMSASRTVGTIGQGVSGAIKGDFSVLSGGISSLAGGLTSIGGPVGVAAGAALASIGAAASAAAVGVFTLTKEAAAYGGKITDLSQRTGLGAEALSAMDLAAKQSGSSIEEVSKAVTKFNKTAGEAAQGSKEATEKLEQFGITPREAIEDLQGSLAKVFARIKSLPPGVLQTKAAMDAFGKSGANLIPVINAMDGDLDGFIAKAKELGVVIDDTTAAELDKFDDMLVQLGNQFEGLKRQIGVAFLPLLTEMAAELGVFIAENKDDIKSIASDFAGFTRAVLSGLKQIVDFVRENEWAWKIIKSLDPIIGVGSAMLNIGRQSNASRPSAIPTASPEAANKRLQELQDELESERLLREQQETRRLKALSETSKLEVDEARRNYQQRYDELLEFYQKGRITKEDFDKQEIANVSQMQAILLGALARERAIKLADAELTAEEKSNIEYKYQLDVDLVRAEEVQSFRKRSEAILQVEKIQAAERLALVRGNINRSNQLIDANLAQRILEEQVAYEKGEKNAKETAEQILNHQKGAISAQIANLDTLIETLKTQKGTEEEIRDAETQRAILLRQRDNVLPLQRELEKLKQIKQEKQELLDLERELRNVIADAQAKSLEYQIQDLQATLEKTKNVQQRKQIIAQIEALEIQAANLAKARALADLEEWRRQSLERIKGKENEEAQKAAIEELYRQRAIIAEEEFQRRLKEIREKANPEKQVEGFASAVESVEQLLLKALKDIAEGLGQALAAWVLYGETGPAVLRKVTAQALATMAQSSAVEALVQTAKGFAALATGNVASASNHFKAAAVFGAAAVAAGVAGRVIAGDSFKKESGRESVSGRQTNSGNANQGQAYSSMQEQTVDVNRASSFGAVQRETVLVVKDKSGMFSKLFQVELEKNSKVRQSILRTV